MMNEVSLSNIEWFILKIEAIIGWIIVTFPLYWPYYVIGIIVIITAIKFNKNKYRPGED